MKIIDVSQNHPILHPGCDHFEAPDALISEPCPEVRVGFGEFGRRAPSSIEKALYSNKPCVTFEVFLERGSSCFTSSWLTY